MLQLIVSRTGYGKTTFIQNKIKELVQNQKEVVLIIPEQISFESERDILRAVGAKNLQYVNVMSFSRFYHSHPQMHRKKPSKKQFLICKAENK